jgi:TPR repeat protein
MLVVLCCNCTNKGSDDINDGMMRMNPPAEPEDYGKIVLNGDTDAYYAVHVEYMNFHYPEESLFYALVMANKYDYQEAYFDVFECLYDLNNEYQHANEGWRLDSLDETSRKMALEYLVKATEKGHKQSKEILGEYYLEGLYVEKDTILGKRLIKESAGYLKDTSK